MRVAVTGTTGRVGAALANHFEKAHQVTRLPRKFFDLADRESMAAILARLDCDVLINPAGITGLEACEDDPAMAHRVNTEAPAEMAKWAAAKGIRFIHFSTDYVFDGKEEGLKREEDIPHPLSVYAASKLAGEQAVLAHPRTTVIRVSWVFGPEKPSFIDQIHQAALAGTKLTAIADKSSLPTSTHDLALWVDGLIAANCDGLFHACQSGAPTSWHGMACAVIDEMVASGKLHSAPNIEALNLADVTAFRAVRPRFTAMDNSKLALTLDTTLRPWQAAVSEYVRNYPPVDSPLL